MQDNPFIPFTLISSKLFRIEHNLFQTNASFFKKILLAIGIPRIDITSYSQEIKYLYSKFQTILNKTTDEEKDMMSTYTEKDEFINKMDECILAMMEVIEGLERKLHNNSALKLNEFNDLTNKYKIKKSELLQITERITSADKKSEEDALNNLHESIKKWENKK